MLRRFGIFSFFMLLMVAVVINVGGLGLLRPSAAQNNPPVRMEIGGINAEEFPTLILLVNVWDMFGVPVPGLTVDDFQVMADGTATRVVSVENITEDDLPISIVLVIDTSESMAGGPLADAQAAALAFIDRMAPTDEIALIDFDSTVKIAVPFTTDRAVLRAAIEGLQAGGRTALYDAVYAAADLAAEAANSGRFVVFLTDGNEYGNLSRNSAQAGIDLAVENNVAFYVFGLGYWLDVLHLNVLAEQTHGSAFMYPDSAILETAYQYLATFLRTQYVVTIDSGLEPDGRSVELAITAGNVTQTVEYTTPNLYPQITIDNYVKLKPEGLTITFTVTAPRGLGTQSLVVDGAPLELDFVPSGENTVTAELTLDPYDYAPGFHTFELSATDAQGGTVSAADEFFAENVPPVFEIVGLADGTLVSDPSFDVSVNVLQAQTGQAIERVEYRIDGQTVATATEPPYTADIDVLPAGSGAHTFEVAVIDASGETVAAVPFTADPVLFITPSPTPTATFTPTNTPTATFTHTPSATNTDTPEPTVTDTDTPEPSETPDLDATTNALAAPLTSTAASWTDTPEPTATDTDTPEPAATDTDTPEPTATDTDTPEPSFTPSVTNTFTPEPTATETNTPTATRDIRATADAIATSVAGTATMNAQLRLTAEQVTADALALIETATAASYTDTPEPTAPPTDTPAPTATDTDTPEPTATDTAEPTQVAQAVSSDTPEPTATDTEVPTVTAVVEDEPTASPTALPEPVDVDVDDDGAANLTDYWPVCLGGLILLGVLYVVLSRGRRQRTVSGG